MSSEPTVETRSVCPECHRMAVVGTSRGHSISCSVGNRVAMPNPKEPTVEECLRELREMFPTYTYKRSVTMWNRNDEDPSVVIHYKVHISEDHRSTGLLWEGYSLTEIMNQVRRWHRGNKQ